jgi:ribosomal protein L11 methylase PrmA
VGVRRYFPNATCAASDLDPHCAEEFDKIFRLNGMEADLPRIPRSFGPGGEASQLVAKGWRFDCVVSNIYAEVLAGIVKEISQLLVPGGAWVASGILAGAPEQTLLTTAQPYFDLV